MGHSKHLLNVQYRMHPSISLFPNQEFYGNKIKNGSNVKERGYNRSFFDRDSYGSYSFINVANGREEFDKRRSLMNNAEVSMVLQLVSKIHKGIMTNIQHLFKVTYVWSIAYVVYLFGRMCEV